MKNKIISLIHQCGIPHHLYGYAYLVDAIEMCASDPEYIHTITKRLYPDIAEKHNTTSTGVERAIRHAVETAFENPMNSVLHTIFGNTLGSKSKPTNGHFIAALTEVITRKENI